MPRMTSPDSTETLSVPDSGVPTMKALGWSLADDGSRSVRSAPPESAAGEDKPKRSSGRPRKTTE